MQNAGEHRQVAMVGHPLKSAKSISRLEGAHYMEKIPAKEGSVKARVSMACNVCNQAERELLEARNEAKKKRPGRETSYRCKTCVVPLCVVPCMELYHTKADPVLAYKRLKQSEQ